ncbi:hypothetical protein, partial [Escherichia coli]|uniref:hypothetical protein n=1 Tax=Escherichia coli TaxID=562 RepID=UPI001C596EEE
DTIGRDEKCVWQMPLSCLIDEKRDRSAVDAALPILALEHQNVRQEIENRFVIPEDEIDLPAYRFGQAFRLDQTDAGDLAEEI